MKTLNTFILLGLIFTATGHGQSVVLNRSHLNGILGSQRTDEGFETLGVLGGIQGAGLLSSTNGWSGGPYNLVTNGVTFSSTYPLPEENWIEWDGNGYEGSTTRKIYSSGNMLVDFWNPTLAFGLDLKDFPDLRQCFIAGVTVYGADDATVLYANNAINILDPANGVFFGFQAPGGIGAVEFSTVSGADPFFEAPHIFSPKIDNLSFSTAPIPEPSTVALGLFGFTVFALRRCRKM